MRKWREIVWTGFRVLAVLGGVVSLIEFTIELYPATVPLLAGLANFGDQVLRSIITFVLIVVVGTPLLAWHLRREDKRRWDKEALDRLETELLRRENARRLDRWVVEGKITQEERDSVRHIVDGS